jgi:ferredoxin-NADP reductase
MNKVDNFLNNTTMYRLVLYYLEFLTVIAAVLSLTGILPFSFGALIGSVLILLVISWATNTVFSRVYQVPANVESVYISALILALIITPVKTINDCMFLFWAAVWTMASKYIFAIGRKHIFNPVAIAVALTAYTVNQSASWWIGTLPMLPFVFAGGALVVRKIRRTDLVYSFLTTSMLVVTLFTVIKGSDLLTALERTLIYSPLVFFAFIMLTEPLTTPPTVRLQIWYGGLVGVLFAPQVHIGSVYLTPESALLIGNLFSYAVSPKVKLMLKLKEKIQIAPDMYDFVFAGVRRMNFTPGQYMEWTFGHPHPDDRGIRRYFTIASSPTETDIRVGIKFYKPSSSYKRELETMRRGTEIIASQLSGDFVLPHDSQCKCVCIAGGIGITPFRSMVKYLIDTHEKRSITILYSNRYVDEIVYKDVFDKAQKELGINMVYVLTGSPVPSGWKGESGHIHEQMIKEEVPDYPERVFYLSGPNAMVNSTKDLLLHMGIAKNHIRTDYFPGFA